MPLINIVPDAETLLGLEPADLGMILLRIIQTEPEHRRRVTPGNIEVPLWNANSPSYPHNKREAVGRAFAEAWQWLQNEGLLMVDLDQPNGWWCLTRKGACVRTDADVADYRQGNLLPAALLHPTLLEKVRPMFVRGDYDTAVFQAFKQVEVAVRKAAALPADLVGVPLMRRAFHPENGPLTDTETIPAERDALMQLFAGAIGHAKNPPSHRETVVTATSAAQLILFASYLLFQIDLASQN